MCPNGFQGKPYGTRDWRPYSMVALLLIRYALGSKLAASRDTRHRGNNVRNKDGQAHLGNTTAREHSRNDSRAMVNDDKYKPTISAVTNARRTVAECASSLSHATAED